MNPAKRTQLIFGETLHTNAQSIDSSLPVGPVLRRFGTSRIALQRNFTIVRLITLSTLHHSKFGQLLGPKKG
jgi:hypothetical protein